MKKTTKIIVIGLIVVFMLAGLLVPMLTKGNSENKTDNIAQNDTDNNKENKNDNDAKENAGSNEQTAPSGGNGSNPKNGSSNSSDNSNDDASQSESQPQAPVEESTPPIPTIDFPYAISGTDLVVEQIGAYDGYFIEDGSDRETSGIAAIVLTNKGKSLRFVGIGISQGTRSLAFTGSLIPAGATVILQEQNGAEYSMDPYYSATATVDLTDNFEMSEDLVSVKDNGNNKFIVTNLSDKILPSVKVYFKNYLPEDDIYVGGIAYCVTLNDVEPNESTDVSASHYASDYSVILEVSVEQ